MRKADLIEALKDYPDNATVWVLCTDGKVYMPVNSVSCETTKLYPDDRSSSAPIVQADIHIDAKK